MFGSRQNQREKEAQRNEKALGCSAAMVKWVFVLRRKTGSIFFFCGPSFFFCRFSQEPNRGEGMVELEKWTGERFLVGTDNFPENYEAGKENTDAQNLWKWFEKFDSSVFSVLQNLCIYASRFLYVFFSKIAFGHKTRSWRRQDRFPTFKQNATSNEYASGTTPFQEGGVNFVGTAVCLELTSLCTLTSLP
ncbi:hypothetical protein ACFX1R_042816 [Malus domestica]